MQAPAFFADTPPGCALAVDTAGHTEVQYRVRFPGVGMGARLGTCVGVATALLLPLWVLAGEISGTLSEGGKPLRGVEVKLVCGNRALPTKTDDFGRYRLEIAGATGRCKLSVAGAEPTDVFLFAAPTRYDFERAGKMLQRR
jgi:hypothetical protein